MDLWVDRLTATRSYGTLLAEIQQGLRLRTFGPFGYKWARMIESVSAMARFFPQAQVHKGLGNILTDFMLVCDHDITWLRFQPFPDLPDNPAKTYGTSGI